MRNFVTAPVNDIVFVPGLGCTMALFQPQIAAIPDDCTAHVLNTREHDRFEDMVSTFLDTAPEKFHLAGLSMGGYICFEILKIAPERVAKLILMDTKASLDTPEQTENRFRIIDIVESGEFDRVIQLVYPLMVHPARADDPLLYAKVAEMLVNTGADVYLQQLRAIMSRWDMRPLLSDIEHDTLVMVGEQDALTPVSDAEEINALIPNCRLEVLPGAGHLPTMETPEQVNDLLAQFINGS